MKKGVGARKDLDWKRRMPRELNVAAQCAGGGISHSFFISVKSVEGKPRKITAPAILIDVHEKFHERGQVCVNLLDGPHFLSRKPERRY